MSTDYDLDHLLDELDEKGPTVTLFAEEWDLPSDVDAETMLRVQRLQMKVALAKKAGRELTPDDVVDDDIDLETLVRRMAGDTTYEAWMTHERGTRKGLSYRELQAIAGRLYAIHSGDGKDGQGKAPAGGPGSRTRTSTGSGQSRRRKT